MIHLDYRDARPIYAQIADNLRNQITASILQPGDRLPSVRELAAELAINPNTIQRAYRELEMQGWIATVPGKGCFVCKTCSQAYAEQPLWNELDRAVAQLLDAGVSLEDLLAHIRKGGNNHA